MLEFQIITTLRSSKIDENKKKIKKNIESKIFSDEIIDIMI